MSRNARGIRKSSSSASDNERRLTQHHARDNNGGMKSSSSGRLTQGLTPEANQTASLSPTTEYWSPGQSIPIMTPPSFQGVWQPNQLQETLMTPHTYNTLHSTPSSQKLVAPSPLPRLTEILESQKKLETLLMSVLERLDSLENRTLTSTSSTASSGKDEVKRRVPPELQ